MFQIIAHTPFYVWLLLAYLVWGGWKSTKPYIVSWRALLPMPALMLLWSAYAVATRYAALSMCLWGMSIALGIWLGSLTIRRLNVRFDKKQNLIEVGGDWIPLLLSLSIFSLRYFLGATYGMYPELTGSPALLGVENVATVVSGMLTGRLWGYWQRSKTSPHTDLGVLKV